jgi:hypothetical protein
MLVIQSPPGVGQVRDGDELVLEGAELRDPEALVCNVHEWP